MAKKKAKKTAKKSSPVASLMKIDREKAKKELAALKKKYTVVEKKAKGFV